MRLGLALATYCWLATLVQASPNRIQIGVIFEKDAVQADTSFRYELEKHNNSTASVYKLSKYQKVIRGEDSYDLTKAMCSIMAKGIMAIFGVSNTSSSTAVYSYSRKFSMPYVTPSAPSNTSANGHSFVLHLRPTYDNAVLDIIRHYKWSDVFYIYDNDEGLARLQHLHSIVNDEELKVRVDSLRLIDIDNSYSHLRHLDSRTDDTAKYIIIDLSTESALQQVLKQIQNVGMNRASYHYLLGGLVMDELNLEDFKYGGVNITGFRLVDPTLPKVQAAQREWSRLNPKFWIGAGTDIRLDAALTMDGVTVIVEALNAMLRKDPDVFRNTFRRGRIYVNGTQGINCRSEPAMPWDHGAAIMRHLKQVKFEGVTGGVAFDENGYRTGYKLDVLELGLNSEPKKIGTWSTSSGLNVQKQAPTNTGNGSGVKPVNNTRVVTTIMSAPYLMPRKQPDEGKPLVGNERYEGYCAEVASEIARIVKFDYIMKLVTDGMYGEKKSDGTWNGMVGELTDRTADLAIAPLTISSMRERVIDFSKPFMQLGISIMIKKPEKQKPGVFSFMDPLSYEIWMCIIFAYLGVSVVLFLVSRFSPYEWQIEDNVNGPTFTNDFTLLNSLWFSLGAFMQQGCDISPRSLSGRIVGSVWWFFTLILISSYTANLAAFLTVERMLTPIESADDLAKQTAIQYGTIESGSTKNFFSTSKIAVYERMWNFMNTAEPKVFARTTEEGVTRVRNAKGKYAFLLESTMNDYHNQRKPCNTMKVGGNLDSKGYGIATPLDSDLREAISLAVLHLRERGVLQKLHKKWWYDKGECAAEAEGKGSTQSALTLSNVAGIFYILIGGLGLSMIVSLLEFLYKSKKALASSLRVGKGRLASLRGAPENGGVGTGQDVGQSMSTVPIARSSAVSLV